MTTSKKCKLEIRLNRFFFSFFVIMTVLVAASLKKKKINAIYFKTTVAKCVLASRDRAEACSLAVFSLGGRAETKTTFSHTRDLITTNFLPLHRSVQNRNTENENDRLLVFFFSSVWEVVSVKGCSMLPPTWLPGQSEGGSSPFPLFNLEVCI